MQTGLQSDHGEVDMTPVDMGEGGQVGTPGVRDAPFRSVVGLKHWNTDEGGCPPDDPEVLLLRSLMTSSKKLWYEF